jgi:hypothetical protein
MKTFHLRIMVEAPPAGVVYALQKGVGTIYDFEQIQKSTGADLRFELDVKCEGTDCKGPHVAGKRGDRFIYINVGTAAGQHDSVWSRRIKVPLAGVSEDLRESALEARILGTARDGTPTCATQRPLGGWRPLADI